MSLSETVARLEAESAALEKQEKQLLADITELEQSASLLPADLHDRLQSALARLPAAPVAGEVVAGRDHYNALALLEQVTTPPVLDGEAAPESMMPAAILFDEPERRPSTVIPDWMINPEEIEGAESEAAPGEDGAGSRLNWLDDMAGDDFQAESGPSDGDITNGFLSR